MRSGAEPEILSIAGMDVVLVSRGMVSSQSGAAFPQATRRQCHAVSVVKDLPVFHSLQAFPGFPRLSHCARGEINPGRRQACRKTGFPPR